MEKLKLLLVFLILSLIGVVFASVEVGDNTSDGVNIEIPEEEINYSRIPTVNKSDFWDELDTPADIAGSSINNDAGWISTDTNASTECSAGEHLDGGGYCTNFNDSVKNLFEEEQVVYNATSIITETGTLDSGDLNSITELADGDSYNVSEVSGAVGFLIYINFTNVTNFNTVALRGQYEGGAGHTVALELLRVGVDWEERDEITDQNDWGVTTFPVFIGSNFIDGDGTVQFRINHDDNGIIAHNYFLDAVFIGQVSGLVSGGDLADLTGRDNACVLLPDVFCKDGTKNMTGNSGLDNNNITYVNYINPESSVVNLGNNGVSFGSGSSASGLYSFANGNSVIADGDGSFASGLNAGGIHGATGDWAFSSGYDCLASGGSSFCVGYESIASGNKSFAFGQDITASGNDAIGILGDATGNNSVGIGTDAIANNAIAIGYSFINSEANTIKLGVDSTPEIDISSGVIDITGKIIGVQNITIGIEAANILISNDTITSNTGAIYFGSEWLDTSNGASLGTIDIQNSSITDNNGFIDFDDENLTTTGVITLGRLIFSGTNIHIISSNDVLVTEYNWLKSSDRDGDMGDATATNRRTLLLLSGVHSLTSTLTLDEDFIDVVGISGNPYDTIISRSTGGYAIEQSVDDVTLSNLRIINTGTANGDGTLNITATYNSPSIYRNLVFNIADTGPPSRNVVGTSNIAGTWEYITSESNKFMVIIDNYNLSGTFRHIALIGTGHFGVGGTGEANGTFEDITGVGIFQDADGKLSGKFRDIKAGDYSFMGAINGTFINVEAGDNSFGYDKDFSGNCYYCKAGHNSFAYRANFSGNCHYCVGGNASFGGYSGSGGNFGYFSGKAYYSYGEERSFGGGVSSGGMSGELHHVQAIGLTVALKVLSGAVIEDSRIEVTEGGANREGILVDDDTVPIIVRRTTILCTGFSFKGSAGDPEDVKVSQSYMDKPMDSAITNLVEVPFNVIEGESEVYFPLNLTLPNLPQEPSTAGGFFVCWNETDGHLFLNETKCRT